jgi:hypothetical protein
MGTLSNVVSIPVKDGRKLPDPANPKRHVLHALMPMREVVRFTPDKMQHVNPRLYMQNPTGKMPKIIYAGTLENPGMLHWLNRGVTLVAEDGKVEGGNLILEFGRSKLRGLLDGGTTVSTLRAHLDDLSTVSESQYLNVKVLCGDFTDDEIVSIAEALNKSAEVSDFAIANLGGEFEWIKQEWKGARKLFGKDLKVSWATNEPGDLDIEDIIQYMALFMMEKPQGAYSSKNKCLKHYEENLDEYMKLRSVLLDIIKLSEYVPLKAKSLYEGKFKRLSIIADSGTGETTFPIMGEVADYPVHKAWVFPLLASLEAFLDKTTTPYTWKDGSPFSVYDQAASELIENLNSCYKDEELHVRNLNALGKAFAVYALLKNIVKNSL